MQRREKGTGTIVQRDSGTWSGRVSIGRGDDGKIKYKYFSGKTEAEVKKKIREYNKSGCPQDAPQILFKDYLLSWLTNIKKLSLKPSSYDRLEATALKQVIPRLGDFKISEITPEDISKMMNDIKDEGLSYSSTKKAFDCVNAVMTYAFNKRDILFNPASLALKPNESNFPKKEIRYFTKKEAALITEECGRKYSTGAPVYPYGDAFILALHTGLHMGELIGLQKNDINFEEKRLIVRRNAQVVGKRNADGSRASGRMVVLSTTKTYSGTRIISLNNIALEAAQRLCDSHPNSQNVVCGVRGGQVTHERFERSFYRVLDNCGIEKTGVHSLRHTFASMLFEQGVDILSFNMGAKNDSRIKETYKKAITVAMVFGAVALALFQIFPRQIVSIFGSGDELYFQFAERYMRVYMMLVCLHGVQPLSVNYFTAIGNVRQGIVLSLSRQGFFLIPLLLLPLLFGLNGALYAGPIADSLACMLSLALVFRNFRELILIFNKKL